MKNPMLNQFYSLNLKKTDSAVCLVSGGMDSMVLLELLCRLQKERGFLLSVLHFNFHLRGNESNRDECFVRDEAQRRGLNFVGMNVPLVNGSGIQERARKIRRQKLPELAEVHGWMSAFVAHHADDQLETVIMHGLRGAGLRGLKGMEPVICLNKGLKLCRPLLTITRNEIDAFAQTEKIPFVEDSSNQKDIYWRNRVRHQIVPLLKEKNPKLVSRILSDCRKLWEDYEEVKREAWQFLKVNGHGEQAKRSRTMNWNDSSTWIQPFLPELQRGEQAHHVPLWQYFSLSQNARFLVLETLLKGGGFEKEFCSKHFCEIESLLQSGKFLERNYGNACLTIRPPFFEISREFC